MTGDRICCWVKARKYSQYTLSQRSNTEQRGRTRSSEEHTHTHTLLRLLLRRLSAHRHLPLPPLAPLQRHPRTSLHGDGDCIHEVCVDDRCIPPCVVVTRRVVNFPYQLLRRLAQPSHTLDSERQVYSPHSVCRQLVLVDLTPRRLLGQPGRS